MVSARKRMLKELMAYEFTAIELNLYLDTHPRDRKALDIYNKTVHILNELKHEYQTRFGPLTNFGFAFSDYPWGWIEEPWPWQINFADRERSEI